MDAFDIMLILAIGALFGLGGGMFIGMVKGYSDAEKHLDKPGEV